MKQLVPLLITWLVVLHAGLIAFAFMIRTPS